MPVCCTPADNIAPSFSRTEDECTALLFQIASISTVPAIRDLTFIAHKGCMAQCYRSTNVTTCTLVGACQRFGGTSSLHIQDQLVEMNESLFENEDGNMCFYENYIYIYIYISVSKRFSTLSDTKTPLLLIFPLAFI